MEMPRKEEVLAFYSDRARGKEWKIPNFVNKVLSSFFNSVTVKALTCEH